MDAAADAAYGSLLGACVGDAAGAVLEFIFRMPTEDEVRLHSLAPVVGQCLPA
jgi:ADP-ribosylglycohydrolase